MVQRVCGYLRPCEYRSICIRPNHIYIHLRTMNPSVYSPEACLHETDNELTRFWKMACKRSARKRSSSTLWISHMVREMAHQGKLTMFLPRSAAIWRPNSLKVRLFSFWTIITFTHRESTCLFVQTLSIHKFGSQTLFTLEPSFHAKDWLASPSIPYSGSISYRAVFFYQPWT